MHTIQYILQHGLESLTTELGITVKERDNLLILDYDQITSPKTHPVVMECRGLILEKDTYKVVFRCMERFFNYTEAGTDKLDYSNAKYFDKVDGSLIKIFNYNSKWYIATRGTIIADNTTAFGITFEGLVLKALNVNSNAEFQSIANPTLNPNISYNFEVTSVENRVVTKYEGYSLTYLNARNTETGEYVDESETALALGAVLQQPVLSSVPIETVFDYVDNIPDLKEGVVAYINGIPICKFKNKLYVDIHHTTCGLVNEHGLSTKRVVKLVLENEYAEYLSYFPEKEFLFTPYIKAKEKLLDTLACVWLNYSHHETIKDFAIAVKGNLLASMLITKYRNQEKNYEQIFADVNQATQIKLLEQFKET